MRGSTVRIALAVFTLSGLGAALCEVEVRRLQTEGQWLLARSAAQADEFTRTLDGSAADAQLSLLGGRRAVLERASLWGALQIGLTGIALLCGLWGYAHRLYRRALLPADPENFPVLAPPLLEEGASRSGQAWAPPLLAGKP